MTYDMIEAVWTEDSSGFRIFPLMETPPLQISLKTQKKDPVQTSGPGIGTSAGTADMRTEAALCTDKALGIAFLLA